MKAAFKGVFIIVCLIAGSLSSAVSRPLPFLTGGDISMLLRQEQAGVVFKDAGGPKDFIALMTDAGCNCFRVRLFVNPTGKGGVVQDVPYALEMAKRIKAANGLFLLNFHYSDTWADPAHQTKPAAWKDIPFDELVQTVQLYTADVIAQFKKQDLLPDIVQLGNEIHPGFLWPDGRLGGPQDSWLRFTQLLNAAVRGLRSAAPDDDIKIMIHIACGGDFGKTDWFFSNLQKYDVPYDLIGQSYYPWWHGTLKQLEDNLARTAKKFRKDIVIVETAYPNSAVERFEPGADPNDAMPWPMTPDGQRDFLAALLRTVRSTPDNRGRGVIWWYPESVSANRPGGWYNGKMAIFDPNGIALPAMQSFAAPKAVID